MKCAAYIWNRCPTTSLTDKTPYECWFGKKTDLSNVRVFGCVAYAHVPNQLRRKKLDPKSKKCIFMGYPDGTKGFKLYNLAAKKFIRTRSVLFCEDNFHDFGSKHEENDYITFFSPIETSDSNREDTNDESEHSVEEESESENSDDGLSYEEKYLNEVQNIGEKRPRAMPDRFEAGANVVSDYCFATSLITDIDEPSSVEEAMSDPNWMQAMRSEMASLHDNLTWESKWEERC